LNNLYDPLLGRFLSPDPVIQAPGNSQSYNRYSYCLNNPLIYTDPSGYVSSSGQCYQDNANDGTGNGLGVHMSNFHSSYDVDWGNYANYATGGWGSGTFIGNTGGGSESAAYSSVSGYNSSFNFSGMQFYMNSYTGAIKYYNNNAIGSFLFSEPPLLINKISHYFTPNSGSGLLYDKNAYYLNKSQLSIRERYDAGGSNNNMNEYNVPKGFDITTKMISAAGSSGFVKSSLIEYATRGTKVVGDLSKYSKLFKNAGIFGSTLGVVSSSANMWKDYSNGENINIKDASDFAVGLASLVATIFLATNPVGIIICGGAAIYFTGRLLYDVSQNK